MRPFYENKQIGFRCFLSKDITFPAHLHNEVELIFIREGVLEVTVSNQTKKIRKGEAALIFPDMVHSYLAEDSCLAVICIFAPSHAKEYYQLFRKQQPKCPFFTSGTCNPDIPFAFDRMLHYAEHSRAVSEAWLNLILAYLMPEAEQTGGC